MTAETVNYFLESVLKEIKDSIQSVDQKLDNLEKGFDQKLKTYTNWWWVNNWLWANAVRPYR